MRIINQANIKKRELSLKELGSANRDVANNHKQHKIVKVTPIWRDKQMAKKQKKVLPTNRRYWDEPTISPRLEQLEILRELTAVTITQKFRNFKINEIICKENNHNGNE